MNIIDFFELKLATKIWYNGSERTINALWFDLDGIKRIDFKDDDDCVSRIWSDICCDCSLEPQERKVFYRHYWCGLNDNVITKTTFLTWEHFKIGEFKHLKTEEIKL